MAHYAYLDENNIVTFVCVGRDDGDTNWEEYYGNGTPCKRTSYNTKGGVYYTPGTNTPDPDQSKAFRKNYAGVGFFYDNVRDAFIPPQPYPSWSLDEQSCWWFAPVPYPSDENRYTWDEANLTWVII